MIFKNKSKSKNIKANIGAVSNLRFDGFMLKNMLSPIHIDIKSNREAVVEGCNSIEEYDENMVKIKVSKMVISFFGKNLAIKCMSVDSLVIEGIISSIEFNESF